MSDKVTEWFIEQLRAHGLEAIAFFVVVVAIPFVVFGFCFGRFFSLRKLKHETAGIKLDNRKKQGDLLKTLEQTRAEFRSKRETLNLSIAGLRDVIANKSPASKIDSSREELCRLYEIDYLAAFDNYSEQVEALADRADARFRGVSEIIPGLQTMCRFLDMVNHPNLLAMIGNKSPFLLNSAGRDGLLIRTKRIVPFWHVKGRWLLLKIWLRTRKHLRKD